MKKETIQKARRAYKLVKSGMPVWEAVEKAGGSSNSYYKARAEGLLEKRPTYTNPSISLVATDKDTVETPKITPKRPPKTVATSPKKSGVLTLVVGEISLYCFKLRLFKFSRD